MFPALSPDSQPSLNLSGLDRFPEFHIGRWTGTLGWEEVSGVAFHIPESCRDSGGAWTNEACPPLHTSVFIPLLGKCYLVCFF